MNSSREILTAKLLDMDLKYKEIKNKIYETQFSNEDVVLKELKRVEELYCKLNENLENNSKDSKSDYIKELSKAQLEFNKRTEKIQRDFDNLYIGNNRDYEEQVVENIIVYAEYSVDMALYSMINAILISLKAVDCQIKFDEKYTEREEIN